MKKLLALLAAVMIVLPLVGGCSGGDKDTGEITIDGIVPDADAEGDNEQAGGAEPESVL